MNSLAITDLSAVWDRFIQYADQNPRSLFAAILAVLAVLLGIAIISLFSRLRNLKSRNRQLAESVEALSTLLAQTRADLDAKILALSAGSAGAASVPSVKDKDRELPAALMREELVSLQLDLRDPEEQAEPPALEEKT